VVILKDSPLSVPSESHGDGSRFNCTRSFLMS
jgi:hypothetical protein